MNNERPRQLEGSRQRTDRSKADSRERIIEAAARLFEAGGFGGTTLNSICAEAGVGKSALYQAFPDKWAIAGALLDETLIVEGVPETEVALQEIYDTGIILAYRITREVAIRAALRLSIEFNARDTYGTPWPAWIDVDTKQLTRAQTNGEIGPDVDVSATAYQIAGAWAGITLTYHAVHGNLEDLEEHISRMYKNLFIAIAATPRCLVQLDLAADRGRRLLNPHPLSGT
ncbi:TetR/AcrR family transcriptional regulator [Streptomyces sp. NBC_00470]|uniref:TetR/AcrR family transcriptional regulator n=1 Tax=Streptomyces sp. NBC_00470 TaxID=2975753 RepID=UPI002F914410